MVVVVVTDPRKICLLPSKLHRMREMFSLSSLPHQSMDLLGVSTAGGEKCKNSEGI